MRGFIQFSKSHILGGKHASAEKDTLAHDRSNCHFSTLKGDCNRRNLPHFELSDEFQVHKDSSHGGGSFSPLSNSNKLGESQDRVEKETPLQDHSHSLFSTQRELQWAKPSKFSS